MEPRKLDRLKVCPFLIRCFVRFGEHTRLELFADAEWSPFDDELHVYAWPDSSLREICEIVKDAFEDARHKNAKLSLRMIYADQFGKMASAELGIISSHSKAFVDQRSLSSLKFQNGDFLDIAVFVA